jgi:CheY-like chemotaxis protein
MEYVTMKGEPLNVLLVEDDPGHAELIRRNFAHQRIANRMSHVADGEEALEYLFRKGAYAESGMSPVPHVVLLDLRLPKVDGIEVLKQIRQSESLNKLPVVVLTSSAAETDIARAYDYHANSYVVKPLDFAKFSDLMDVLGFYWLGWNCHPYS